MTGRNTGPARTPKDREPRPGEVVFIGNAANAEYRDRPVNLLVTRMPKPPPVIDSGCVYLVGIVLDDEGYPVSQEREVFVEVGGLEPGRVEPRQDGP